jgi:hypothetical protein
MASSILNPHGWSERSLFLGFCIEMEGDFEFSALDFDRLTGFDSFDDLEAGFDGLDAGDGDGGGD